MSFLEKKIWRIVSFVIGLLSIIVVLLASYKFLIQDKSSPPWSIFIWGGFIFSICGGLLNKLISNLCKQVVERGKYNGFKYIIFSDQTLKFKGTYTDDCQYNEAKEYVMSLFEKEEIKDQFEYYRLKKKLGL